MGDALNPQAVASGNRLVSVVGHVRGLGHECLANELTQAFHRLDLQKHGIGPGDAILGLDGLPCLAIRSR